MPGVHSDPFPATVVAVAFVVVVVVVVVGVVVVVVVVEPRKGISVNRTSRFRICFSRSLSLVSSWFVSSIPLTSIDHIWSMLNASRCTNQSTLNNLTSNGGFDGESFQKQQTISNCFLKYCCFHCFWCCCSNLHLKVPDRVLPQGCPSQWYWFAGRFCPQPYSLGPISVSALYVGQEASQSFAEKLCRQTLNRSGQDNYG